MITFQQAGIDILAIIATTLTLPLLLLIVAFVVSVLILDIIFIIFTARIVATTVTVAVWSQVGQQLLDAQKQVEQLQDELSRQTKSGQTSQEALAIEHKCTRDKLQVCSSTSPFTRHNTRVHATISICLNIVVC